MKKIIIKVIMILFLIYGLFILEEAIRLSYSVDSKPLIIIKEVKGEDLVIYKSLGFKLINKYGYPQVLEDGDKEIVYIGQEFWLFDNFLVWGWIS